MAFMWPQCSGERRCGGVWTRVGCVYSNTPPFSSDNSSLGQYNSGFSLVGRYLCCTIWSNIMQSRDFWPSNCWPVIYYQQPRLFAFSTSVSNQPQPFLRRAGFWSRLRGKCLDGGLSCYLTDEMQTRFCLGGFLLVKPVWHVVLSCFFISVSSFLRWTHTRHWLSEAPSFSFICR